MWDGLKNESSSSIILAPNNTGLDSEELELEIAKETQDLKQKAEEIYFKKRARKADIKYERDHNRNVDKGVYTDIVD